MKKIIIISLLTTVALYATNGDNLIAIGTKSKAMGGVGIATAFGTENAISNPALLSHVKGKELNIAVTYFAPTIKTNGEKSDADKNFMPQILYAQEGDENFSYSFGIYGAAGMGVDFRNSNNPSLMKARTNLVIMNVAPSIAYKKDKFSFGITPIVQYGSLNISYNNGMPVGEGKSDHFGYGFKAGLSYDITPRFRIGGVYKSSIEMTYDNTLSVASQPFAAAGIFPAPMSDKLEQPEEYGIGLSYDLSNFNFSADYKNIKWGSATGYKDFGWVDQDVYAIGAKYEKNGTWYAIGYNYAKNPITKDFGPNAGVKAVMNTFNYILFPATQEEHYTFGTGRDINENLSIDLGIIYGAKNAVNSVGATGAIEVSHSEVSATVAMKYKF